MDYIELTNQDPQDLNESLLISAVDYLNSKEFYKVTKSS